MLFITWFNSKFDLICLCILQKVFGGGKLNILFWNTYRNKHRENIDDCLINLIMEKSCDIIVLSEYKEDISSLCNVLNIKSKEEYIPIPNYGGCEKIKGLIKKKYRIDSICEQTRYQIVKIETISYKLLICMIHNISKQHASEESQKEILSIFHHDICIEEEKYNTQHTLVIGDINANPFEISCIAANSLHAIPYIEEVQDPTRVSQGKKYLKFYNPMWRLLGNKEAPYGTFYYQNSDIVTYYWNMFDQIIIRPQLINSFDNDSLVIVTETKKHKLLNGYKPNKNNYSDHLPIFCTIKEENIE